MLPLENGVDAGVLFFSPSIVYTVQYSKEPQIVNILANVEILMMLKLGTKKKLLKNKKTLVVTLAL